MGQWVMGHTLSNSLLVKMFQTKNWGPLTVVFVVCVSGCAKASWRCSTTYSWRRSSGCSSRVFIFTPSLSVHSAHHAFVYGTTSSSAGVGIYYIYTPLRPVDRQISNLTARVGTKKSVLQPEPSFSYTIWLSDDIWQLIQQVNIVDFRVRVINSESLTGVGPCLR